MNKTTNKTTTHKDTCADLPLEDHKLDKVSGGVGVVHTHPGGADHTGQSGQNDPAQMFQQILQQVTQGQG